MRGSVGKDYTGKRFGHWTILKKGNAPKKWVARCDCGAVKEVWIDNLKSGKSTCCNRCKGETSRKNATTHGESKTHLYYVWYTMKKRCTCKSSKSFADYGARGIKVCDSWMKSYVPFRDWALSHGYADGLQIDRIDNNGGYSPENCRWVTHRENMQNTRRNKHILFRGKEYTPTQLADMCGKNNSRISERLRKGWSAEEAMSLPVKIGNNQTLRG